ncbi:hypothetical protein B0H12DRAFT_1239377 [Mycena haematopus]|nr:hypothetical protein B0H12DRAFT_1239377 [Mycena haematopus]
MLDPPTPRSTRPDRTAILDARIDIDDAPRSIYALHCDPRPHKRTSAYLSPACSAVTLEPYPAAPFQRWDFEPLPRSQGPPHQTAANTITSNPQIKMQVRGTSAQLHPVPPPHHRRLHDASAWHHHLWTSRPRTPRPSSPPTTRKKIERKMALTSTISISCSWTLNVSVIQIMRACAGDVL